MRKMAYPIDVANAILFLSSPTMAGHTTGSVLEVTGGMEGRVLWTPTEALL
jgi:NAD(P)-dependent dehydrogenase (short-subunit alcohol dehydrogenase family)